MLSMSALLRKLITNEEVPGECRVAGTGSRFFSQTPICRWLPKTSHVSPFRSEGNENGLSCAFGLGRTCLPRQLPLRLCREIVFRPLFTPELCRGAAGAPVISRLAPHAACFLSSVQGCVSVSPCVCPSEVMIWGLL